MRRLIALSFIVFAAFAVPASGAVKPNPLVSDGMVLQRRQKVPIWGTADAGEKVTVSFQGRDAETIAAGGAWTVWLDGLETGGPFEMTIRGDNEIRLKDVYVGEVWLCAGQMNMDWPLHFDSHGNDFEISKYKDSQLRFFQVRYDDLPAPQKAVRGGWKACTPESAADFSAVAYYFGSALRKKLNVPVGLIQATTSTGTADEWIPRFTLETDAKAKEVVRKYDDAEKRYADRVDGYMKVYEEQVRQAVRDGKDAPPSQPPPNPFREWDRPAGLYNGMIAPLEPYAIRGVAWYQGESDVSRPAPYEALLTDVVESWREAWKQPDMPFLVVQLGPAGRYRPGAPPHESAWAEVREAERLACRKLPHTALVVTETGEDGSIEPPDKEPVGEHLALAARAVAYGEKVAYTGPVYESFKVEDKTVVVHFTGASGGLKADGGPLHGFAIAGDDGQFVNANGIIRGDCVLLGASRVPHPVAVRYGWEDYPEGDLMDGADLFAGPFRTDTLPFPKEPPRDDAPATKPLTHDIPASAIKIDLPGVQQRDDYSCGAAAVMAVCSYFGVGPDDLEEFKKKLGTNEENGTNVYHIRDMARELGLEAAVFHGLTLAELRKELDDGSPVIVSIQAYGDPLTYYRDDNGHYVVVIGYDDADFYFEDPVLPGRRGFLPLKEFDRRWHDDEGTTEKPDPHAHLGVVIHRKKGEPANPPPARKID